MKKEAILGRDDVVIAGIGGAGVRIVGRLKERRPGRFRLVAMDTNERSLSGASLAERLLMGENTLRGAGTGGAPDSGRNAASESLEPIRACLAGRSVVVCVAGVGGGTGTGALPVILRAAGELGAVTVAVVTLPFSFEGRARRAIAEEAVGDMRSNADVVVVVPCDRLFESVGGGSAAESFAMAEDSMAGALEGLTATIGGRSYLGADLLYVQKTVRKHDGILSVGFGQADGRNRAAAAARSAIESPLLKQARVLERTPAAVVSVCGGNNLQVKEAEVVMQAVAECVGADTEISMGLCVEDLDCGLSVTILAMESEAAEKEASESSEATPEPAGRPQEKTRGRRGSGKSREEKLGFAASARERFKGVDSTVMDGEDLDTPTFVRRGIKVVK
jgi:cell division protein FtsZ